LTIYIIIGTRLEENKLVMEFGDPYIKYQHEVPMLIPFTKIRGNGFHFSRRNDAPLVTNDKEILNLQPKDGKGKPYQVKQVRNVILKYRLRVGE